MKFLLDTHIAIWAVLDAEELSDEARSIILDEKNEIYYSPKGAPPHKDPFDRILLAQAKSEGMKFMTHDTLIPYYNEPFVISV